MRKVTLFLLFCIILTPYIQAQVVRDTVYSHAVLDGMIRKTTVPYYWVGNWDYGFGAGDYGEQMVPPYDLVNCTARGYMTFTRLSVPEGYALYQAVVKLVQSTITGNDVIHHLPVWGNGQYEVSLDMHLVDYGPELDASDWTAGDLNNPNTLLHRTATIDLVEQDHYTYYIDVTNAVHYAIDNTQNYVQFRINFSVDTDWDGLYDAATFYSSDSNFIERRPILIYEWRPIPQDTDETEPNNIETLALAPNPFHNQTRVSFSLRQAP